MSFSDLFDEYKIIKDNHESLFTIVIYAMKSCDIIKNLEHRLELAETIRHPKKKMIVCKKLFEFKEYIKEIKETTEINSIFLVCNTVNEINLNKEWLEILKYYNVDKFIFKYGNAFEIDYLQDLLTNTTFRHVINIKNNLLMHIHLNTTKKRIHHQEETKSIDINNYIKLNNIKEKCIIHGVSNALKNFKTEQHFVFTKQLKDEEIFDVFNKDAITIIHKELQGYLDYINNDKLMHRIIFGKDVSKKILNMELEAIYCNPDIYDKIIKKVPKNLLNFKLTKVNTLGIGDPGDILTKNFTGIVGITYF